MLTQESVGTRWYTWALGWTSSGIVETGILATNIETQVIPKGARLKEPAMDCFSTLKRLRNKRFFMMHTSALVPLYGPAGTFSAFPQRIAGTFVGQEHAPTETSRLLSTGPQTCCRLQSFGTSRPLLRLSLALGPTMLGHTYIPRLQSGGALLALGLR